MLISSALEAANRSNQGAGRFKRCEFNSLQKKADLFRLFYYRLEILIISLPNLRYKVHGRCGNYSLP